MFDLQCFYYNIKINDKIDLVTTTISHEIYCLFKKKKYLYHTWSSLSKKCYFFHIRKSIHYTQTRDRNRTHNFRSREQGYCKLRQRDSFSVVFLIYFLLRQLKRIAWIGMREQLPLNNNCLGIYTYEEYLQKYLYVISTNNLYFIVCYWQPYR